MPRSIFLLAFWLCASPLAAQEFVSFRQDGERLAAARVVNWFNGYQKGAYSAGTGTFTAVDDRNRGLVVTAAHLFDDKLGPITVEFQDGQVSGAKILAMDRKLDVAALLIHAPQGIKPLPLAEGNPDLHEEVEIWGYGPKQFRSFVAQVCEPIMVPSDPPGSLLGARGLGEDRVTIPGDSGGPIVRNGQVVGVHWGYRGSADDPQRCVHAVGVQPLRVWLQGRLPYRLTQRWELN